jgi:hypothetical protein
VDQGASEGKDSLCLCQEQWLQDFQAVEKAKLRKTLSERLPSFKIVSTSSLLQPSQKEWQPPKTCPTLLGPGVERSLLLELRVFHLHRPLYPDTSESQPRCSVFLAVIPLEFIFLPLYFPRVTSTSQTHLSRLHISLKDLEYGSVFQTDRLTVWPMVVHSHRNAQRDPC